jgi:hypothetical protein
MRVALAFLLMIGEASAQALSPVVVTTCGTPPLPYTAGEPNALMQNTAGLLCIESACPALPAPYVAGQSYPLLIDTDGNLCSSGG